MKKHLIAAAVAAAVAVPAAAQVTVYGAIGYGVEQTKTSAITNATTTGTAGSYTHLGQGTRATGGSQGLGTSVIGFRGSEDLGGGLKANFQLEGSLNTNSGEVGGGSSNTATNQTFDRQSWVGVSGGFGDFRFGRTATATKDIEGFGDVGTNIFDLGAAVDSYTDRFPNTVRYQTPTFSGLNVVVTQTQGAGTVKTSGGEAAGVEITSYVVNYASGPVKVGVGKSDSKTAAGVDVGNTVVGASYNAGIATIEAAYQSQRESAAVTNKLTQLGAIVPLGKGMDVRLNYSKLDVQDGTASDLKWTGLMGVYQMSKRTRAYVGYRDTSAGSGAAATVDSDLTTVGLIHSF
jgi:predicted porin